MNLDTQTPDPRPQTPDPGASDPGASDAWLTPGRFALVLAALLAVTFWRVLFGGEAFFYRDYGFLGYPFAHFHRECFWSGDFFPLWNPYVNCGAPFLAQWNTQTLYPGSLIYLLLPLPWSLGFFCVAHLFLGGMGMRALAERWTGSRFGAAVAGVAFVFSGLVLGCVIYPNYLVALGWMPWVVLATRRAWQEGGRSIVLAALAGAMQMLSGAPEIILLTWGLLAALLVTEVFSVQCSVFSKGVKSAAPLGQSEAKTEHWILNTDYFPTVRRYVSVIALITGLCAAQLLPFFQLLSLSQRSGDAVNTFWSLPGWGWVNLFFPLFMNFQTEQGVFVMIGQSFFPSVYLGIVPLTLALLAVWRIGLRGAGCPPFRVSDGADTLKRGHPTEGVWEVRLLAGATLLTVLLAMGDNFVLWRWLREVLPLGVMRFPVKALLLAAFTVPLLAAWGIRHLFEQPTSDQAAAERSILYDAKSSLAVVGLVFALGLVAALEGDILPNETVNRSKTIRLLLETLPVTFWLMLSPVPMFYQNHRLDRWTPLLVLIMIPLCGSTSLPDLNPTIPASAFEPGLAAAYHASKGALTPAPKLGESRLMLSPLAERALHTRMVPKFYDDFIGQRLAFWGNLNLLDGLPKVNGASTLVTREWNDVEYFLYGTTNPAPANLMDFLGVTHTTKPGELMQWERQETAMPLVSAGQKIQSYDDGSQSVGALLGPNWNPREAVFISAFSSNNRTERVTASVRVRHFQPRAGDLQSPPASNDSHGRRLQTADTDAGATSIIEIETEAAAPTVLVIAQNFYPSWRAAVNGQPVPVLRANRAFQAVPIPAGKSTIRLDYVDWPFRIGALVSLLTGCGCLLLWRRAGSRAHSASE
ncbi:MAG: YfhO family protein [Limisphaerales bacterium]